MGRWLGLLAVLGVMACASPRAGKPAEPPPPDAQTKVARGYGLRLFEASYKGDVAQVKDLLEFGVDVHWRNSRGDTPLHAAAGQGHRVVVELLLKAGADVRRTNALGLTPLHRAAGSGRFAVAKRLLDHGANLEAQSKFGSTPLHLAARTAGIPMIDLLLGRGADVNATSKEGETALHMAANYGRGEVVEFLIERGADINRGDREGWTALHYALLGKHSETLALLLARRARIDADSVSLLHLAAARGYAQGVALLLRFGADASRKDGRGNTPLEIVEDVATFDVLRDAVLAKDRDAVVPFPFGLFRRLLVEREAEVTQCFEAQMGRGGGTAGQLWLDVVVDPSGQVIGVSRSANKPEIGDPHLVQCMARFLNLLRIPRAFSYEQGIRFPLEFKKPESLVPLGVPLTALPVTVEAGCTSAHT